MIEITYKHNLTGEWERPIITDQKWKKVWFSSYSMKPNNNLSYRWNEWQAELTLRRNKIKIGNWEKTNIFPIEVKWSWIIEILVGN